MARLFTGIFPSDAAASETGALRTLADERSVRWMPESNLHATLVFLGGVPEASIPTIEALLASVRFDSFDLALTGVGAFPAPRSARVLWTGLEPAERVIELRGRVAEALGSTGGFGHESSGTYHPHMTIGRSRGRSRLDARPWIARHSRFRGRTFHVGTFALVWSRTKPEGAEYTVIGRFGGRHPDPPDDS